MKNYFAAVICAAALFATPVHAGSLSDPVVTPEVVADAAANDSGKEDGLILTLWLATLLAAAGGAF